MGIDLLMDHKNDYFKPSKNVKKNTTHSVLIRPVYLLLTSVFTVNSHAKHLHSDLKRIQKWIKFGIKI